MVAEHRPDSPSLTAAVQAVARRFGLGRETVRRWVVQADIDGGGRPGVSSQENAEIRRLKAENRRLREDVEILKAATGFFAQCESEPARSGFAGFFAAPAPVAVFGGLSSMCGHGRCRGPSGCVA